MMMRLLPKPINETTGEPSFRWRRISAFALMGVCLMMVPLLGYFPPIPDTLVNQKIVDGCFALAGWAFLIYAGAATGQDITAMITTKSARPYADPPPAVNTVETKTETKSVVATQPSVDPPPHLGMPE